MWILKLKVYDKNCIYATKIKNLNLQAYETILTHYKKGNSYFFMSVHILIGLIDAKKEYISLMRKDKRVKKIDVNGDMVVELVEKKQKDINLASFQAAYNPEIVLTKPGFVDTDGWEYYEFASWNRAALSKIIKEFQKTFNIKIMNLKETSKYEIYMPKLMPKLSDKQKEVLSVAVKENYYAFPRKKELKELAKLSKISFSTFREHLRKAESKILPLMYKDYILNK